MDTFYRGRINYALSCTPAALGAFGWIDLPYGPTAGHCATIPCFAGGATIPTRATGTPGWSAASLSRFYGSHGKERARDPKSGYGEITRTASDEFSTILFHYSPLWETSVQRSVLLRPRDPIRTPGSVNLQQDPNPSCPRQKLRVPPPLRRTSRSCHRT